MLANAFRSLLEIHSRPMTIERVGEIAVAQIKATPSNYFRNLAAPEDMIIEGREFVISKAILDEVSYPAPRRGDRLKDTEIGVNIISEVREMYDFGGKIIGYRVRTS